MPAQDPTFAFDPEGQQLAERERLIQSLLNPERQERPSATGGLGTVVNTVLGALMQRKQRPAMEAYAQQRQQALKDELANFLKTYNGVPGGVELPGPLQEGQKQLLTQTQPGDPHAAVVEAMTSRFPEMRAIGGGELGKLIGRKPSEPKYHTVGNNLVRTLEGPNGPAVDEVYRGQPEWVTETLVDDQGKSHTVRKDKRTGRVEEIFRDGTSVNIDTKGNTLALGKIDEKLEKHTTTVSQAREAIANSTRIYDLASDPDVIAGFAAGAELGFKSLAKKLGWEDDGNQVAKGQALLSAIARKTLDAVPELKGAISEKEKPFLEQAAAGAISYTPEALRHLANLSQVAAHNKAMDALRAYQSISQVPGAESFVRTNPMPPFSWKMDPKRFEGMPDVPDYFMPRNELGVGEPRQAKNPAANGRKTIVINGREIPINIPR